MSRGKGTVLLSFSERGAALAARLAEKLNGEAACAHGDGAVSLLEWTRTAFAQAEALVFVGAAGIAVRAIAPYVHSKATDPAVVVVDECGHFAVPLLSGHLGGANDLARRIAHCCGATAVITTATDANGCFAVDEWAKRQNCVVMEPERIKNVSAKVLAGESISIASYWPVTGCAPDGVALTDAEPWDVALAIRRQQDGALHLTPRIAVLGVGCRRGTTREALEEAFAALLEKTDLLPQAFCGVATIDLKENEAGLLAFCKAHGWTLQTYPAAALGQIAGTFTPSPFVTEVTGVDNVCERSAVLASGGALMERKNAGRGVTMAVAVKPYCPDWRWQDA